MDGARNLYRGGWGEIRLRLNAMAGTGCILSVLLLSTHAAHAEVWAPLTASELRAALTDRTLDYENAWQRFEASGKTLYNAGDDSWGWWDTRGDQYCSRWPPGTEWSCYDVEMNSDQTGVRFLSPGDITIGRFRN